MPGPLPVSPDTALKLSKFLGVPVEHLMHMPRHILLQKLAEMAAKERDRNPSEDGADGAPDGRADGPASGQQAAPANDSGEDEPR